jgi:hypothetical protein
MSDVGIVALATGGFSLATAAVGAIVTAKVNHRSTAAAVETARRQGETELGKLRIELDDKERLRRDGGLSRVDQVTQSARFLFNGREDTVQRAVSRRD